MKAIDKEDRALLAELNNASVHALYITCSLLKQWVWGLNGGHTEDDTYFPELTCRKESERKWLLEQAFKVERHAWDCLGLKGYLAGQNIPNGLYKTINAKVAILNQIAEQKIPDKHDYRVAIITQTGVMLKALERLKVLEKHREPSWRYLTMTLATLCKRVTAPSDQECVDAVYTAISEVLAGLELIEDWQRAV